MIDLKLLLATDRFTRLDRIGRVRHELVDGLRRWARDPAPRRCCPPPCCFCCWEAL